MKQKINFFSITENCETLFDQILTKPQETLESQPTQPREGSHLKYLFLLDLVLNG